MIVTPESCSDVVLVDASGVIVPGVIEFDTDTEEATVCLIGKTMPGSFMGNYDKGVVVSRVLQEVTENECCAPARFQQVTARVKICGARLVPRGELEKTSE